MGSRQAIASRPASGARVLQIKARGTRAICSYVEVKGWRDLLPFLQKA